MTSEPEDTALVDHPLEVLTEAGLTKPPSPLDRVRTLLHRYPALSPAVVLIISMIVFGLLNDRFLSTTNLSLVVQQVAVIGALAIGQTLIILTAGIDLSVGAAMILSTLVAAGVATDQGWPGPLALLVALVVGIATGVINGVLVTRLNLPPFIVTLGTLNVFTAVALLYSAAATTRGIEMPGAPDLDRQFIRGRWRPDHLRCRADDPALRRHGVRPEPDLVGPPCVRRRR